MRDETLRRILVAKHLLVANSGQLTPDSDPVTVARMLLVAHDASELTIAAIASDLNLPGLSERITLTEYVSKIEVPGTPFPGADFVRQLNAARVGFKHHGILPDARDWFRVIDNTWRWLDQWCQTYLRVSLNDISIEQLIADPTVKGLYEAAKEERGAGSYKEALESLGHALYLVLRGLTRSAWPTVGQKNTEDALMLSAFGVRPSDFLALQDFLPTVGLDWETRTLKVEWQERETGHPGNWTDENVRFCLETFLDLVLKTRHAPSVPRALPFAWMFDDVIVPKGESADLFEYVFEGHPFLKQITGRKVVRTLKKGEKLRCRLSPSQLDEKPRDIQNLSDILGLKPTLATAEVLTVWLDAAEPSDIKLMYVERKDVDISVAPKDNEYVRSTSPHLFTHRDNNPLQ